jgi:general secretion pathway protein L
MPETVLGLDISPVTVKAILLEKKGRTGGRIIAMSAINININDCGGFEPALKKIAADNNCSNITGGISLPMNSIMFRQVTLPFADEGKIRKTLPFEIEPLIPYSADEIALDYLAHAGGGLLVAIATKKNVREWINLAAGSFGEVPVMDISPFPVFSLLAEKQALAPCGILVDIGADSATAIFYENNAVAGVRMFASGANQITRAMAEDFSLTEEEAEGIKIRGDYNDAGSKTLAVCRRFCIELNNTIEFMKLNKTLQSDPVMITLTGGGALFIPLQKELKDYFPLPLEIPDLCSLCQIEMDDNLKGIYNPQIMNAALAGALSLSAGTWSFNFRQGEFKSRSAGIKIKERLKKAAVAAGVIVILAVVNQCLDYGLQSRRLDNIKKDISFLFKKNYPEASTMIDPLQQLKTKLAENKKTFGVYNGGSDVTVVDLIKDISGFIPQAADITITNFSYENEVVQVKGEASGIDAVSAAKNELTKSRYFKEVSINSTSLAKQGGKVDFDLRITLK